MNKNRELIIAIIGIFLIAACTTIVLRGAGSEKKSYAGQAGAGSFMCPSCVQNCNMVWMTNGVITRKDPYYPNLDTCTGSRPYNAKNKYVSPACMSSLECSNLKSYTSSNILCSMVWSSNGQITRSMAYNPSEDTCIISGGYRYFDSTKNYVSPSCYNYNQCSSLYGKTACLNKAQMIGACGWSCSSAIMLKPACMVCKTVPCVLE